LLFVLQKEEMMMNFATRLVRRTFGQARMMSTTDVVLVGCGVPGRGMGATKSSFRDIDIFRL